MTSETDVMKKKIDNSLNCTVIFNKNENYGKKPWKISNYQEQRG
jgi:hypothetical protein